MNAIVGSCLLVLVVLGGCSVTNSSTGVVKVPMTFGSVSGEVTSPGVSLIAPWKSTEEYSTLPHILVADGEFLSSEKVQLHAEVQFVFSLNREMAAKVRTYLGSEEKFKALVTNLCQSAQREAAAEMGWVEAAVTKRSDFEQKMLSHAKRLVKDSFMTYGFSEHDAALVVNFQNPIVKKASPPERLAQAIAEQQAAKEELTRQTTETQIATEIANRREQEGSGIAKMLEKLPIPKEEYTVEGISMLVRAQAEYRTASALTQAVESNQLDSVIFTGSAPSTKTN